MQTRQEQIALEEAALRKFQLAADCICHQIRQPDADTALIDTEIQSLKRMAERLFPQKLDLFELVYMRRFQRLWEQWRPGAFPFA